MTITLTLTPEEEAQLRQKAAQFGQPAEDYALALLRRDFSPTNNDNTVNAAEALKDYIGLFSSGGARLSENTGAQFAEGMAEKRREGHL